MTACWQQTSYLCCQTTIECLSFFCHGSCHRLVLCSSFILEILLLDVCLCKIDWFLLVVVCSNVHQSLGIGLGLLYPRCFPSIAQSQLCVVCPCATITLYVRAHPGWICGEQAIYLFSWPLLLWYLFSIVARVVAFVWHFVEPQYWKACCILYASVSRCFHYFYIAHHHYHCVIASLIQLWWYQTPVDIIALNN